MISAAHLETATLPSADRASALTLVGLFHAIGVLQRLVVSSQPADEE
jgi:cyanuric acid amidohydrolase